MNDPISISDWHSMAAKASGRTNRDILGTIGAIVRG